MRNTHEKHKSEVNGMQVSDQEVQEKTLKESPGWDECLGEKETTVN